MDITNITPPTAAPSAQLDLNVQNNAVQAQLTRLPIGVTLVGTVAGNDKNGNLIIRLAGNDLILSSPLALNKDAQVALKIENVSGSFTATLLSIDGKLPATQPQAISNQLQQNPNALFDNPANARIISLQNPGSAKVAPPQTTQTPVIVQADTVTLTSPQTANLKAIIITASPEIAQSIKSSVALNNSKSTSELVESLPEEVTPGSQLNVKITNVQTAPRNPANPQQQVQTDNRVFAKTPELETEATTPQTQTPIASPTSLNTRDTAALPVGILKYSNIPIDEAQPPTPSQNTPQLTVQNNNAKQMASNLQTLVQNFAASFKPLPNGNILLNAIVIDKKPGGELLVETRFGKVIIDAGEQFANVEKGATLDLEITSITSAPKSSLKLPEEELPLQQLAKSWPALKELSERLTPELGSTTIPNKLAGIENNLAARMAAFMNAVKSGDLRDWLGANNYDAMDDDGEGTTLLGKLKHDMGVMKDLMSERSSGGWQTMLFPIYDGRELNQARLHVKYLPDENNQPDKKIGTRFIVELSTGYFGEMQMDGLVHNNISSKYFDMIIRTHNPLEPEMETDIRQIFTDAGEITGFRGDIEFATMKEFPLKIMDEIINKKLEPTIDHKGIQA